MSPLTIVVGVALVGTCVAILFETPESKKVEPLPLPLLHEEPEPKSSMMRRTTSMAALPSSSSTDLGSPKLNQLELILATTSKCAHCGGKLANRKTYVVGRERGDSLQFCSTECRKEACGWNK